MKKTTWTRQRLERLFQRYNKRYWKGRLPKHSVLPHNFSDSTLGQCLARQHKILIDTDRHRSDRKIRSTLLHEMAHAAAGSTRIAAHGYEFFAQLEHLLRMGAPVTVSFPEVPGHKILVGIIPRKFRLCRKTAERVDAARQREVNRQIQIKKLVTHAVTDDEIISRFEDLGYEVTWVNALWTVGTEYALVDIGRKPTSRWAARMITMGKKAHCRARKEFLLSKKLYDGPEFRKKKES